MSVEISVTYTGDLYTIAAHGPSGATIRTNAPVDNAGKGDGFSPTDLMGVALGTCVLTTMGIVAHRHQWDIGGAEARVVKEMTSQPTRRIGSLVTRVTVPAEKAGALSAEDRKRLEHAAHACPVHRSLHPEIHAPIEFDWKS